jgi:hypothetical protein
LTNNAEIEAQNNTVLLPKPFMAVELLEAIAVAFHQEMPEHNFLKPVETAEAVAV